MAPFSYTIRPIQPEKDAAAIADLIKNSFRPWLDSDNISYLEQLHKSGLDAQAHPLWTNITGFPYNLPGMVCMDTGGKILGVVNSYTFYRGDYKCSSIVNVCVDPNHRQEGIATHILSEIERSQRKEGTYGLYLQARMSNQKTIQFYKKRGFAVTDFRETWILPKGKINQNHIPDGYCAEYVPAADKESFENRFKIRYPDSILWNLDYSETLFQPGRLPAIMNRLTSPGNRFLRITEENTGVKAWAAFQQLQGIMDQLWFIPNTKIKNREMSIILEILSHEYRGNNALKLDIPVGEDPGIYSAAGFIKQQTLAWMWKRL